MVAQMNERKLERMVSEIELEERAGELSGEVAVNNAIYDGLMAEANVTMPVSVYSSMTREIEQQQRWRYEANQQLSDNIEQCEVAEISRKRWMVSALITWGGLVVAGIALAKLIVWGNQ